MNNINQRAILYKILERIFKTKYGVPILSGTPTHMIGYCCRLRREKIFKFIKLRSRHRFRHVTLVWLIFKFFGYKLGKIFKADVLLVLVNFSVLLRVG